MPDPVQVPEEAVEAAMDAFFGESPRRLEKRAGGISGARAKTRNALTAAYAAIRDQVREEEREKLERALYNVGDLAAKLTLAEEARDQAAQQERERLREALETELKRRVAVSQMGVNLAHTERRRHECRAEVQALNAFRPFLDAALSTSPDQGGDAVAESTRHRGRSSTVVAEGRVEDTGSPLSIAIVELERQLDDQSDPAASNAYLHALGILRGLSTSQPEEGETNGERCEKCGGPVGLVWWCHDDLLWEKITGRPKPAGSRESAPGVLCIGCFDAEARKVCPWIEWAPLNLRHLQSDEEQAISAELRHSVPQPDCSTSQVGEGDRLAGLIAAVETEIADYKSGKGGSATRLQAALAEAKGGRE